MVKRTLLIITLLLIFIPCFSLAETKTLESEADSKLSSQTQGVSEIELAAIEYLEKGNSLYKSGNYSEAITAFTMATAMNPNLVEAYYHRGLAYHGLDNYEKAIRDYSKAIELNPKFTEAYVNLRNAKILIEKNNHNTGEVKVKQTYTPEQRQEKEEKKKKRKEERKIKQAKENQLKNIQEKQQKAKMKPIELEKKWLNEKLSGCERILDNNTTNHPAEWQRAVRGSYDNCINRYRQATEMLEKDPEYYFSSKPAREREKDRDAIAHAPPPVVIVH